MNRSISRASGRLLAILMLAVMIISLGPADYSYAASSETGKAAEAVSDSDVSGDSDADAAGSDSSGTESSASSGKSSSKSTSKKSKSSKIIISTPQLSTKEAVEEYGDYDGKNARRIPVITYHRVVSDKQKRRIGSGLYISKSNFKKQMKWLSDNGYRTINCQEFYLWYKGKIKLPKKSVLITFDDSRESISKYAFPVLKKYDLKATVFTIGHGVRNSDEESIKVENVPELLEKYPNIEYQSHTYALHHHFSERGDYKVVLKDAKKQAKYFDFQYVAYPFGRNTAGMRKAYKDAGMKMGFTYGQNGYALKSQNRFQIRRIKIDGNGSFSQFTRWFK